MLTSAPAAPLTFTLFLIAAIAFQLVLRSRRRGQPSAPPSTKAAQTRPLVLWILWAAIVSAIALYQFNLGGGILRGIDARAPGFRFPLPMVLVVLAGATAIRWLWIPRVLNWRPLLAAVVIGLALSDMAEFFGIFLLPADMPATKMAVFYAALASAIQFMPVYAQRARPAGGSAASGESSVG